MAYRASNLVLFLSSIIVLFSTTAINVEADQPPPKCTTVLSKFPQFSVFNDMLTKSGVATNMNDWGKVTLFVVDNSAVGQLNALNQNKQQEVLSLHAILEFYDPSKFKEPIHRDMVLTTLLMTTGNAHGQTGFVIATNKEGKGCLFRSAMRGAELKSRFVKAIHVEPDVFSVIQISDPIIPPPDAGPI